MAKKIALPPNAGDKKLTGIERVAKERGEMMKKHDFTVYFDLKKNSEGQLLTASQEMQNEVPSLNPPSGWEQHLWDKMRAKPLIERLVIAAALTVAEIDRRVEAEAQRNS